MQQTPDVTVGSEHKCSERLHACQFCVPCTDRAPASPVSRQSTPNVQIFDQSRLYQVLGLQQARSFDVSESPCLTANLLALAQT